MPGPFVVGQELTLTATFKNEEGTPVNPSTVTFKVLYHNGEQVTISSESNPKTGTFIAHHTVQKAEAGGVTKTRAEGTGSYVGADQSEYPVEPDPFT